LAAGLDSAAGLDLEVDLVRADFGSGRFGFRSWLERSKRMGGDFQNRLSVIVAQFVS
jgi:hypothetical protein